MKPLPRKKQIFRATVRYEGGQTYSTMLRARGLWHAARRALRLSGAAEIVRLVRVR